MGVLNITPDLFSDGGHFTSHEAALTQARRMIAEGAGILDIGAESTRPYGSQPVSADEELQRLRDILPAVTTLGIPVSIDTMKATVAAWALTNGAAIANDIWGLQRDPDMARVVADHHAPVIIMHNRDTVDPAIDIVADMKTFFSRSLDIAAKAGIPQGHIVLDPGIGFGKTPEQSMTRSRGSMRWISSAFHFWSVHRENALSRRSFHPNRASGLAAPLQRTYWRRSAAPKSSARMMLRKRCRHCALHRQSRTSDERYHLHQGTSDPCPARRHGS
jgi:dihydropteroate synthase